MEVADTNVQECNDKELVKIFLKKRTSKKCKACNNDEKE